MTADEVHQHGRPVSYLGPLRVSCGACGANVGERCGLTPEEKEHVAQRPELAAALELEVGDYHGGRLELPPSLR